MGNNIWWAGSAICGRLIEHSAQQLSFFRWMLERLHIFGTLTYIALINILRTRSLWSSHFLLFFTKVFRNLYLLWSVLSQSSSRSIGLLFPLTYCWSVELYLGALFIVRREWEEILPRKWGIGSRSGWTFSHLDLVVRRRVFEWQTQRSRFKRKGLRSIPKWRRFSQSYYIDRNLNSLLQSVFRHFLILFAFLVA